MFVRAKEEIDLPTHLIPKAAMIDLPDDVAQSLIDDGRAVLVETEKAIESITGEARGSKPKSLAKTSAKAKRDAVG